MKSVIKTFLSIILIICLFPFNVNASSVETPKQDISYEPYHIEIELFESSPVVSMTSVYQTKTATKTAYAKDANQNTLWTVSVTGVFIYDGNFSQCISCSHQATSYNSSWSIKNVTSSYSGNSATATAVATHTGTLGIGYDQSLSVSISCSRTGDIS